MVFQLVETENNHKSVLGSPKSVFHLYYLNHGQLMSWFLVVKV